MPPFNYIPIVFITDESYIVPTLGQFVVDKGNLVGEVNLLVRVLRQELVEELGEDVGLVKILVECPDHLRHICIEAVEIAVRFSVHSSLFSETERQHRSQTLMCKGK